MPAVIGPLGYDAVCAQCGRTLPKGTSVRFYSEGKIYCNGEHLDTPARAPSAPAAASTQTPRQVTWDRFRYAMD